MPAAVLRPALTGALLLAMLALGAAPAGAQSGGASAPAEEPAPARSAPPIPRGAPAVALTRNQIRQLQRRLRVRADGVIGKRTRAALRRYQGRRGLDPTGRPDAPTLRALRLPFATTERRPAPLAPATTVVLLDAVRGQLGTPYAAAGAAPGGFDCSGLTRWAFAQVGVELPHSSFAQFGLGEPVGRAELRPGDLAFFDTAGPGASDVGIATSPTTVISATTRGVMEHEAFDAYWGSHFIGARRLAAAP